MQHNQNHLFIPCNVLSCESLTHHPQCNLTANSLVGGAGCVMLAAAGVAARLKQWGRGAVYRGLVGSSLPDSTWNLKSSTPTDADTLGAIYPSGLTRLYATVFTFEVEGLQPKTFKQTLVCQIVSAYFNVALCSTTTHEPSPFVYVYIAHLKTTGVDPVEAGGVGSASIRHT